MKALYLPAPERYTGIAPCPSCRGKRITGERHVMGGVEWPGGEPMLVDVFCGDCGGCGQAVHEECDETRHADIDRGEWAEELFEIERDCGSCSDRGWWACQAFSSDADGAIVFLRMPCGCAAPLLFPVVLADAE